MQSPPVGQARFESMDLVARILSELPPGRFIVELGSTRTEGSWEGDGYSTPFFAYQALKHGHFFYTVDVLPEVTKSAEDICRSYGLLKPAQVTFVTMDGIRFMHLFAKSGVLLDFLYMDAWDYATPHKRMSAKCHLEAFKAIEKYMAPTSYVLIDDNLDVGTWEGKGKKLIPHLIYQGWQFEYIGYQVLMKKEAKCEDK